jgi:hypothetical protein
MKNLFKGILFGLLVGVVLGWIASERAEEERFAGDPQIQAHMAEYEKRKALEKLVNDSLDDLEDFDE